jgi:signal transduction histidine kinase
MNAVSARRVPRSNAEANEEREHEIRAALFGIEAAASGLSRRREHLTPVQVDELADAMAAEVRRLRALLDGHCSAPTTFDLGQAIAPVIASARATGLDVQTSIPEGLEVYGRPDSAAQVVLTLLDNARQHAASSPVEIHATELGGSTVLYVEDRGTAVSGRSRERMFERGVRGADSFGSGLGLFVAKRLMTDQGGSITFRVRPGGGASFVVRFPHTERSARRARRAARMCRVSR